MPKQQSGQLIWRDPPGDWYGRYYTTIDGERVRVSRALHTENKAVARRKLARLIAEGNATAAEAQRPETFEEAARRVVDEQKAAGMVTWKDRVRRLEVYAFPRLGSKIPNTIRASHVLALLEEVRDLGKSRQTMIHVKDDVSVVLGALWRAETIYDGEPLSENVCEKVQVPQALPAATERSKKERVVLTDDELVRYLAWEHPDTRHRMAVLERQVMACCARMFGGLRTSDLHSMKWEGFELPGFSWGYAPRRKGRRLAHGGRPQALHVPELLRPILEDWWTRQGQPTAGLVFPRRKGDGAGKDARVRSSHAHAFRVDLRRAFGIDRPVMNETTRKNGRALPKLGWEPAREPSARENALLTETEYSLPVDFHSWRRAFNQALADAGVNAQQAQALAGHSTLAAHERYLRNTAKARTVPEAALPMIGHKRLGTLNDSPQKTTDPPANDSTESASMSMAAGAEEICKASALPLSYPPRVTFAGKSGFSRWARA